MRKLSWGILSTSNFAARATIPAIQKSELSRVTAIASRDIDRGRAMASRLGIPKVFGSYEELIADKGIDVVYIPLPNHLHVDWTLKSLAAGKHVLCEKPIGVDYKDARRLETVESKYPHLKAMEAFMYRHHPQWKKVKDLVESEAIGKVKFVHSHFSYFNVDVQNIRNRMEAGGGAMLDIGCYCVSLSRFIYGSEPIRVSAQIDNDPDTRIDRFATGMMEFGGGTATFSCGTQLQPFQRVIIMGTAGRIEIEIPFNAPNNRVCRIWVQKGKDIEEIHFDVCDQYTIQADAFVNAILTEQDVPTPLSDGILNMKAIDAVKESARSGTWTDL